MPTLPHAPSHAPSPVLLASLETPLPPLELADGSTQEIRAIDGFGMQLLQVVQQGDASALWPIAQRCLPGATEAFVSALSLPQVQAIVAIASGNAERVLAELGNASPLPAATTPAADQPTP